MGILVPEANLPMGITVSNVYMSFSNETIYTCPQQGNYIINTTYKVYRDQTKGPDTNIRIPISVSVNNITGRDVYSILYDELKKSYPGSQDVIDDVIAQTRGENILTYSDLYPGGSGDVSAQTPGS
jgi:hypothetical protein